MGAPRGETRTYQRKDRFYRQAKASGLRSRAAFKLEELAARLMRPGDRVVDLGAWPGGWLQVAARRVGGRGLVVGVDLEPIAPLGLENVRCLRGDAADPAVVEEIQRFLGARADAILSDMAPKLTGVAARDEARASELVRTALAVTDRCLAPGGSFLVKLFMNADYPALVEEIRGRFEKVDATRSSATRKGSAEMYVVARGFRGGGATRS